MTFTRLAPTARESRACRSGIFKRGALKSVKNSCLRRLSRQVRFFQVVKSAPCVFSSILVSLDSVWIHPKCTSTTLPVLQALVAGWLMLVGTANLRWYPLWGKNSGVETNQIASVLTSGPPMAGLGVLASV